MPAGLDGVIAEVVVAAPSKLWTRAWAAWIAAFAVIEGSALLRGKPQDTLSDHVWHWFGIPQHKAPLPTLRARRLLLLTALAWLVAHFLTGDDV